MSISVSKSIWNIGRWFGFIVGLIDVVIWTREILTRPDRDIFFELLNSVVSLHSIYYGAAIGGMAISLGCAFPVIKWVIGVPRRWMADRQSNSPSNKLCKLFRLISHEFNLIEQDNDFGTIGRTQASKYAQREILRFELLKLDIGTPSPATDDDNTWYDFIANLVPLSQHGRVNEARMLGTRFSNGDKKHRI